MSGWLTVWEFHAWALLAGCLIDWLIGDPRRLPHPVRLMGRMIAGLERGIRRRLDGRREFLGGVLLVFCMCCAWIILPSAAFWLIGRLGGRSLLFAAEAFFCGQLLAARDLAKESLAVKERMDADDTEGARQAVSMIVGRDTRVLDRPGIIRAAVETVAENASDGVIAPLLFLAVGGAPLGMFYKAANTMDSMVGYKNDKYLYFGRAAARLDDLLNLIPARVAGVLMCLGAAASGYDGRNAWRIFRRDRKNHKSPNSAHTEAACAGALQLQLAGPSYYFGKLVDKPTIGDDQRPVEPLDILRAGRILYATAFLALLLFCGVPLMILLFPH